MPSLSIAGWRLTLAALLLCPLVLRRSLPQLLTLRRRDYALSLAAGVFLAAHFAVWISSLAYTSIASSTALVTTNPVWIALASWLFFREKPSHTLLIGIAAAISGSALIFLSDSQGDSPASSANPLLGNLLSLLGSLTVCGYLLIGRHLRQVIPFLLYIWLVYSVAAAVLLGFAWFNNAPLSGYSNRAWLCLLTLAIGPQLIGHGAINWALKHMSATLIAVVILGEPIGSALLAWLIFGERFALLQFGGFALLLCGIFLALKGETQAKSLAKGPADY